MIIRKNRLNDFLDDAYKIGLQHGGNDNKELSFSKWKRELIEFHKYHQLWE